ncbi:MAG TPA: transporter [Pirellulales bacterium]|nr:transporter [Pirellulales bacterium]
MTMYRQGGIWPGALTKRAGRTLAGFVVIALAVTAVLASERNQARLFGPPRVTRLPVIDNEPGQQVVRASDEIPLPPPGDFAAPFGPPPIAGESPLKVAAPNAESAPNGWSSATDLAEPGHLANETPHQAAPHQAAPHQAVETNAPDGCNCEPGGCTCSLIPKIPNLPSEKDLLRPFTLTKDGSNREVRFIPESLPHKLSDEHLSNSASALMRPFTMTNSGPGADEKSAVAPGLRRGKEFAQARHRRRNIPGILQPFYLKSDGDLLNGSNDRVVRYIRGIQTSVHTWPEQLAAPFYAEDGVHVASNASGVALAAYQEDPERLPTPEGVSTAEQVPPGASDKDGEKKGLGGDQKLGEEPEDNSLQFLRVQTVLLKPGEAQFDIGAFYSISEDDFPLFLPPDAVADTSTRLRRVVVPLEIRYGLTEKLQGFVSVPFGWANGEVSFPGFDRFENVGGIGDVRGGLTYLFQQGQGECPDIVATFSFSAPTGSDSFVATQSLGNQPSLGNGFWTLSGDILFINSIDPLVFFYGFGTSQSIEREFHGVRFAPGQEWRYNFGVGFAVNERVTLSTAFLGAYFTEIHANGRRIEGTIQEPLSLRVSATVVHNETLLEPFVEIGMTNDAPAGTFGLIKTF